MISKLTSVVEQIEGLIFDAVMLVSIPVLIWWCQRGLKSESLSEELLEFWAELRTAE